MNACCTDRQAVDAAEVRRLKKPQSFYDMLHDGAGWAGEMVYFANAISFEVVMLDESPNVM